MSVQGVGNAWASLESSPSPAKKRKTCHILFCADDGLGGASPRVFFFYQELLRHKLMSVFSNGWSLDSRLAQNAFCRPFIVADGEYKFMRNEVKRRKMDASAEEQL